MAKVIFHIDINAFFASAHQTLDANLQGVPLVVCPNRSTAVVTTASYEAREYGIHAAMPLSQAKILCKDLVVVDIDFELYQDLSFSFLSIIKEYTSIVQQASIDECYADMSDVITQYERPLDLAVEIMDKVKQELGLPISIGIGPTKFLAKMASDLKKPNGITVLRKREVESKLWPLPIEEMFGIGKKTVPLLKEIGINYIGDISKVNKTDLKKVLGNNTIPVINRIYGNSSDILEVYSETKSMGQSKTYPKGLSSFEEVLAAIEVELNELWNRIQAKELRGRTLTFAIRLDNYKTASRSITSEHYYTKKEDVLERVLFLYDEFDGEGSVTFLSITLSNLNEQEEIIEQLSLFDDINKETTDSIISKLNKTLKYDVFKKGSDLDHE